MKQENVANTFFGEAGGMTGEEIKTALLGLQCELAARRNYDEEQKIKADKTNHFGERGTAPGFDEV